MDILYRMSLRDLIIYDAIGKIREKEKNGKGLFVQRREGKGVIVRVAVQWRRNNFSLFYNGHNR